jgi:hypothetical protein
VAVVIAAQEVHHAVPRVLLTLWDEANGSLPDGGISEAWLEFELEAERWRVPVTISRAELERLVAASTVVLEREKHRLIHAADWRRWGRRGGLATLRKYGTDHFRRLALRRWALARSAA